MLNILYEALLVGIVLTVVGYLVHYLSRKFYSDHNLNETTIYLIHLFVIGIIVHLAFEYFGINKYYCEHGVACSKSL